MSNTNTKELLQTKKQFIEWEKIFISKADAADLWTKLDPKNLNGHGEPQDPWLTKPKFPKYSDFPKRRDGVSTRGSSSTLDDIIPNSQAEDILELTNEHRTLYNNAMTWAIKEENMYTSERRAIEKLREFIHETVHPTHIDISCKPGEPLHKWYGNLKAHLGSTDMEISDEAFDQYNDAVKSLSKEPKDWEAWVTKWENAMRNAMNRNIPATQRASDWWSQLVRTLAPFAREWLLSTETYHLKEINDNTLDFATVGNALRRYFKSRSIAPRGRTMKGAFPTFDDRDEEESDKEKNEKGKGKRNASTKRKRTDTGGNTRQGTPPIRTCKLCTGPHELRSCWIAFPELRATNSRENGMLKQMCQDKLKSSPALAAEIKSIKDKNAKVKDEATDS
ncbi:hypothetical protein F4804DRAFT_202894 [Jackrogersella minutella]|nr:hypothetical protein F4804DRAFT_202894 [Jackrogersella minutella]